MSDAPERRITLGADVGFPKDVALGEVLPVYRDGVRVGAARITGVPHFGSLLVRWHYVPDDPDDHRGGLVVVEVVAGGTPRARAAGRAPAACHVLATRRAMRHGCWDRSSRGLLVIRRWAAYDPCSGAGAPHPSEQQRPGEKRGYP